MTSRDAWRVISYGYWVIGARSSVDHRASGFGTLSPTLYRAYVRCASSSASLPTTMRRPSPLIRLLLGLTVLATVWCLGCDAFDPLLAALFPDGGTTMVCASDGPASASVAQAGAGGGGESVVAAP